MLVTFILLKWWIFINLLSQLTDRTFGINSLNFLKSWAVASSHLILARPVRVFCLYQV